MVKKRWIGGAAIGLGAALVAGAIGDSDIGGDFTAAIVQVIIGMVIVAAGVMWVRYIEAKYFD